MPNNLDGKEMFVKMNEICNKWIFLNSTSKVQQLLANWTVHLKMKIENWKEEKNSPLQ